MNPEITIRLEPSGGEIKVAPGTALQDILFEHSVEFPCGGRGACGKCRVKILEGRLKPCEEDVFLLGQSGVDEGWRLACRAEVTDNATLQLAQWEAQILLDDSPIAVDPREGWGVAIDLGTTTIAAQLVDLSTGNVLAIRSSWNPQSRYGSDIMSRVLAATRENKSEHLTRLIRHHLANMIAELLQEVEKDNENGTSASLREIIVVGNTVMHHLFCGLEVSPLASSPFETPSLGEQSFTPEQLDWDFPGSPQVRFLPCLSGFIGSDILAGILAAQMDKSPQLQVLIDLGTNGEMVVTEDHRILCAATAAGPAFEGARIQMGMRAAVGAIDSVTIDQESQTLRCHVLGNQAPRGICGSGLIDAAASALDLGLLMPSGRLADKGERMPLAEPVSMHQCDFRELQLAKGAIAAGVELLLSRLGRTTAQVDQVYLCGAFGNYLDVNSARRLGLLPFAANQITAMGNTALLGAKMALLTREDMNARTSDICQRIEHFSLNEDPEFMDVYVQHMTFPESNKTN